MVDIVELQYATMLSNRLENFKVKATNPYKINFRCPVCGDSKKSRSKTRGWLLEDPKAQSFHFFCHNCGASLSFRNFLKSVDLLTYNEFISAKYVDKARNGSQANTTVEDNSFKTETPKFFGDPLKKIKKISQLAADHPVKQYIQKRQIPPNQHYRLYYAPKFVSWINSIIPNKLATEKEHPRLIIPFIDAEGKCFGVSARGFDPNGLRYITIMFDDVPKIFGLDKVDFKKPYFVVEGGLDSLFLNNTIAMAGADGNASGLTNVENATFVFDNEPRNKEIHKRMEKLIREGKSVCIWPTHINQKDINEMVLAGVTDIEKIIRSNTYRGLEASLRLAAWRKT